MAKSDTADPTATDTNRASRIDPITEVPQPSIDEQLAAPFDEVYQRDVGGVTLDYLTGEQVITRMNQVLGALGWDFEVVAHGINQEADEAWCLGRIRVETDHGSVLREQFGSQKIKRSRSSGAPMDIGFDLKGAATDALKKCAMSFGVGLYLSRKEVSAHDDAVERGPAGRPASPAGHPNGTAAPMTCQECGQALQPTNFKDGTSWSPEQLAGYGRRKHQRVLCMGCYRSANDAKRAAEQAQDMQEISF